MFEFREALMQNVQLKKHRLIILKCPNLHLNEDDESYEEINRFLSTHTYIDREAGNYLDQLLYWLPINRLGTVSIEPDTHAIDDDNAHLVH